MDFLNMVSQTSVALLLFLRTYAISHDIKSRVFFLLPLGALTLAIPALEIATMVNESCTSPTLLPQEFAMIIAVIYVTFDVLVILITVSISLQERRKRTDQANSTILELILRDGSIYFISMAGLNAITLFFYWLYPMGLSLFGNSLARTMAVLLACRFLLHLREADAAPWNMSNAETATLSWHVGNSPLQDETTDDDETTV